MCEQKNGVLRIFPEKCNQLTSIQLPIITESKEKAISVLGGIETINKSIDIKCTIQADIGTQPLRKPLLSTNGECSGILLRLKRKKQFFSSSDVVYDPHHCSVDVIGYVNNQYTFKEPFDFQFLPSSTNPSAVPSNHPLLHIIEGIPKQFTHAQIDKVVKSLFLPLDTSNKPSKAKEQSNKSNTTSDSSCFLKFNDEVLLKPVDATIRKRHKNKFGSIRSLLTKLFSISPVWTKKQLMLHPLICNNSYATNETLPEIAFSYTNGPFRSCWVSYGTDLKSDNNSRIFQTIKIKIPGDTLKLLQSNFIESEYKDISVKIDLDNNTITKVNIINSLNNFEIIAFGTSIKAQCSFEISYLRDEEILQYVGSCPCLSKCDYSYGWFLPSNLKQIRILIINKIFEKMNNFLSINPTLNQSSSNMSTEQSTTQTSLPSDISVFNDIITWNNKYLEILNNNIIYENEFNLDKKRTYPKRSKKKKSFNRTKRYSTTDNQIDDTVVDIIESNQQENTAKERKEKDKNYKNKNTNFNSKIDNTMELLLNNANVTGFDVFDNIVSNINDDNNDDDNYSDDDNDEDEYDDDEFIQEV